MGKVELIEQQIAALTSDELASFRRWYASFDADAWDRQIESDLRAGKLDTLMAEARADFDSGKAREL
ncbi:MAG: hypothetical protein ABW186_15655 [Rhodanobacteraceae bacterium]